MVHAKAGNCSCYSPSYARVISYFKHICVKYESFHSISASNMSHFIFQAYSPSYALSHFLCFESFQADQPVHHRGGPAPDKRKSTII